VNGLTKASSVSSGGGTVAGASASSTVSGIGGGSSVGGVGVGRTLVKSNAEMSSEKIECE
jgi:hypothetical protein